jgi:excisionase family DNA binding protein
MKNFYAPVDVAELYGVKLTTVWTWIREKKLPALKLGKNYRIRPEDLERFEKSRETITAEG